MMSNEIVFNKTTATETRFGFEYSEANDFVFFGKKNCTLEDLKKNYPQFIFRQVKQTHSDILIQSQENSEAIEADAHWTIEKNVALVVQTADCIPILICDETANVVLAVHAGWRGIKNQITLKSIEALNLTTPLKIYIGPHIQKNSFECDLDVKNLLDPQPKDFEQKNNKFYIDLKNILISQINSSRLNRILKSKIYLSDIDTLKDLNFNSFRRDKDNCSRNLSFIVKT